MTEPPPAEPPAESTLAPNAGAVDDPGPDAGATTGPTTGATRGPERGPLRPVPKWVLPVIGSLIVVLVACTNIGNAVWASWVNNHPLGLLGLNSSIRYLLATSVNTEFWPFTLIGVGRLLAPDPLFYTLGFLYRDRALRWGRRAYPGMDRLFDQFEQDHTTVKTVLYPLLVIAPNNPVCLLAGVAAIPVRRFILLNVIGTVGRVLLFRRVGYLFEDQIKDLLDLVSQYQRWLTIGSIALVALYVVWQVAGNRGLAGNIDELGDDLGDD